MCSLREDSTGRGDVSFQFWAFGCAYEGIWKIVGELKSVNVIVTFEEHGSILQFH